MNEPHTTRRVSDDAVPPRSLAALWIGILGPPVIWLVQFEIKYALAGTGHASRHGPYSIATSIVAMALVVLIGYVAVRERQIASASPLDAAAGALRRNRFMSTLGYMSSGLFLLLTIAQFIADFYFAPGAS